MVKDGVLAGAGISNFITAHLPVGRLQQRVFFSDFTIQLEDGFDPGSKFRSLLAPGAGKKDAGLTRVNASGCLCQFDADAGS